MSALRLAAAAAFAFAAAASAPSSAQTSPVQVINLYSYGYAPSPITLTAGRPVTLSFVNRAGKGHDFTAREFFAAARILSGTVKEGGVGMGPGQTKTVTLVPAAGAYHVHCSHFLHDQLGMHTMIYVR